MAIIRHTKDETVRYAYLNIFPDQFKTETEKQDESYIKNTLDYFANKAYAEYVKNRESFSKNYDILKGIVTSADFYQENEDVKSFTDMLTQDTALPAYVKNYSILTTPVNELVGEITKRPDTYRVKAFDDDSKAEELQWKTEVLQKYVLDQAKQKIIEKAAVEGIQITEEELQQKSFDQVKEELDSYTSVAEKWGNKVLTAHKAGFNFKEMSEDAYRDLLTSNHEYFHIYEDNSKTGFNVEVSNPKNTWFLTSPDRKYTSDVTGRNRGAYAAGTVHVMEISEIIESCPELSKEEIDHLRSSLQDYGLINVRESNLGNPSAAEGIDSIQYDTFDPLVLQTRMMIESEMKENNDGLQDFLGLTNNVSSFGYKYVVVTSYWASKKKIGKVVFDDEMGNEQSMLVDEHYVSGTIPTEKSLEWGWINQWYQGKKIGPDIYHMKPFTLLPYCPIIGTTFEIKNTESRSFVDMMKPFQVIYNVAMNQLYELMGKEIGKVQLMSLRHVPIPKDGNAEDALDIWEAEARARGVVFVDDSPENLKAPSSFNQFTALDLTRTQEIQSRYTIAQQMKAECWELAGFTKQRMGNVSASETATGTNAAMQQSYSQTEPLAVAHEYVLGQVYQGLIDASLYIEAQKETSTLSYITSEGENAFVKVNGNELRFRDLQVFMTNRPEDTIMFNEIRSLSQAIIQNGGSVYDIVELYSTKSQRELKKVFKDLRDKQDEQIRIQQEQKQQELDQRQQQFESNIAYQEQVRQAEEANQNNENELDRINRKEIAAINALRNNENALEDTDNSGLADSLELTKQMTERATAQQNFTTKMAEINKKSAAERETLAVKREELQVDRENMANDLQIAKENRKGRNTPGKK